MYIEINSITFIMRSLLTAATAFLLFFTSCQKEDYEPLSKNSPPSSEQDLADTLFYLALGDSYTKGEGVVFSDNFPNQLTARFNSIHGDSLYFQFPRVVARTGWTAQQLRSQIDKEAFRSRYDLITLLIGVNNQYLQKPFSEFERDYTALLEFALSRTGQDSSRLLLLSIPDYAYTPFGQNSSKPEQISTEIDKYNAYIEQQAESLGLAYIEVTSISRMGLEEPGLVAADKLHPSEKMYARWVERMLPVLEEMVLE